MEQQAELEPGREIGPKPSNLVAILDAGAQYGKLIDRRVRGLMVKSHFLPLDTPYEELEGYSALIISGGPQSVYAPDAPKPDNRIWESDKPILGICYGMQLINQAFGGTIEKKEIREDGPCTIEVDNNSSFFAGLESGQKVLMSHGDSIGRVAPGFKATAKSGDIIAGIADRDRQMYGVQFHPEIDLSENGVAMLGNFLFRVADLEADYPLEDRLKNAIEYIREKAGFRQVLAFASGGVDSTVCSVLVNKALPKEQVKIVHVDTGFMRQGESVVVQKALSSVGVDIDIINAKEQFFSAATEIDGKQTPPLREVTDPEVKRIIIGDTFMKIMDKIVADLDLDPDNTVLAQGTLRPDLIESASSLASSKANVIKTHHNDTQLVRRLREAGRVIEPLQELHKDEVRELGEMLDLPDELVWRQPFPGPGLAIRLLCAREPFVTERFDEISEALAVFADKDITAHLLPVRTVGVQGDGRSYSYLAALSGKPDWDRLIDKANEITNQIHDINRVVYVFGDKFDSPINDITPTLPTSEATEQLRQADHRVNEVLRKYELSETLSQVPVISFPINFGQPGKRSIAVRTFITNDFMTGVPATPGKHMPENALLEMVDRILEVPGIARVAYDLTSKPPGTTEWE